ncbi:MarR family winged helix-turn-helix transcriptional regulator [Streptomyces sp. NPDC101733]|uniref:MarR family winged helix-turn-helix transcriptional regulator n=1 Tax=unclassified Streptomyces TaxID=2593676 RepID=UPI00382494B8
MYDRGHQSRDPSQLTVDLLSAAGRAVEARAAQRLGARGLSPLHQAVLTTLAELGPHARRDLATHMERPEAEASRVIDDLLARGLVQTMIVNVGGRQEVVAPTPAGASMLRTAEEDLRAVQDVLLSSLTKGERTQLHYLLHRVCATAARTGGTPH